MLTRGKFILLNIIIKYFEINENFELKIVCRYIKKKNRYIKFWKSIVEILFGESGMINVNYFILICKSNIHWYFPRCIITLHKNDKPSSCLPGFDPTCSLATFRCQVHSDERIAHRTWTRADGPSARSRASGAYYGPICTEPVEGEAATRDTWPSPGSYPPMKLPRSLAPSSGAWSASRSPPHI